MLHDTREPETPDPGDVTRLLRAWRQGDAQALDDLMPLVYAELQRMAHRLMRRERAGHTLQPTALLHEACLKLLGAQVDWTDRTHFFAVAARQMRHVLVDHAHSRAALKRGGGVPPLALDDLAEQAGPDTAGIAELDDALHRLEALDRRKAQVIELRYFGGLGQAEIAAALGISRSTVDSELRFAKAWLGRQLGAGG